MLGARGGLARIGHGCIKPLTAHLVMVLDAVSEAIGWRSFLLQSEARPGPFPQSGNGSITTRTKLRIHEKHGSSFARGVPASSMYSCIKTRVEEGWSFLKVYPFGPKRNQCPLSRCSIALLYLN